MSEADDPNVIRMPCGCCRSLVERLAPAIDEEGHPKLNPDGSFIMVETKDIQESYCTEHSGMLIERQQAAQRALESGASADEAIALLTGATVPALADGKE